MKSKQYFVFVVLVLFVTLTATACREKEAEIPVVALFTITPTSGWDFFKISMAELGYVEGENVTYVVHDAGGEVSMLPQAAQEIVDADVDVIATVGAETVQAIWAITGDIPIVTATADPIQEGLVDSLRDHGRNLTGVATYLPTGLQLETLLEIAPGIERIFVPFHPDVTFERMNLDRAREPAEALGVELVVGEARSDDEVADMLANLPDDIDAIFIPSSRASAFKHDDDNFIPFAIEHKLPLAVSNNVSVANGALIAYTYDGMALNNQAARLTDKVLTGTPIAKLPIERPDYFLTLNLRTAEAIGLKIPNDILEDAHEIIR